MRQDPPRLRRRPFFWRRAFLLAATTGSVGGGASLLLRNVSLERSGSKTNRGPAAIASLDFELARVDGTVFRGSELRGRPFVVFLGFTNCPDVCPTTLFELSTRLVELGERADSMVPIFLSVDPDRDRPEILRQYMASFDPRIVALSGDKDSTDKAVASLGAYYRKIATDAGYTIDHTAVVMLYDGDGRLQGTVDPHEPAETQRAKLEKLIT